MHVRNDRVFFGHRCMQPSQGKIVACVSNFGSMLFQELAGSFVAHETDLTNPLRKKPNGAVHICGARTQVRCTPRIQERVL